MKKVPIKKRISAVALKNKPVIDVRQLKTTADLTTALRSIYEWKLANKIKRPLAQLIDKKYTPALGKKVSALGGMKKVWVLLGVQPPHPGFAKKFADKNEAVNGFLTVWRKSPKLFLTIRDVLTAKASLGNAIIEVHGGLANLCRQPALARIGQLRKGWYREKNFASAYALVLKKHGKVTKTTMQTMGLLRLHGDIKSRGGYEKVRTRYTTDLAEITKRLFYWSKWKEKPPETPWFEHPDLIVAAKYHGGPTRLLKEIKSQYSSDLVEVHLKFIRDLLKEKGVRLQNVNAGYLEGTENPWPTRFPAIFFIGREDEFSMANKVRTIEPIFSALANENFGVKIDDQRVIYFLKKPFSEKPEIFNNWPKFGWAFCRKLE